MLDTFLSRFWIVRNIQENSLQGLAKLPEHLPEFVLKGRYLFKRKEKLNKNYNTDFVDRKNEAYGLVDSLAKQILCMR